MSIFTVVFLFVLLWIFLIFITKAIVIVRPYEAAIVERFGKYQRTLYAGLHFVIPIVDRVIKVDLREQVVDVPPQEVITKDNVVVTVDGVIYYKVVKPEDVVYKVQNFKLAVINLAQTNLRNIIGELTLDETLTSREVINSKLRITLDEATDSWGVKVTRVELKRIDPPRDVMEAMHKQMKAEREKRAMILEAEGYRESQIKRAEGEKQAKILQAEGRKQAQILEAEGQSKAIRLVADAERYRILAVFNAIKEAEPTGEVITVQYLDALRKIAEGEANKVFFPVELSKLVAGLGVVGDVMTAGGRKTEDKPE
ncbi:MAG: SPFH/Band 7/PHB domain protein [Thermotogae bacterium]|nr:SPFH/Band 7/PHB domain protein [Thermotogota bacterium]